MVDESCELQKEPAVHLKDPVRQWLAKTYDSYADKDLRELILRMARENAQWGYRRIVGELGKLHLPVSKSTVSRVLKDEQIYPEPNKGRGRTGDATWQRFIQLHMSTLVACDFFTKAVVTPLGIRTAYFLFFIHLGSRRVYLTSATSHTDGPWVLQQARHFRRWCERQGIECSHLIHDRDRKFPVMFDTLLQGHGVRVIKTPFRAPNANAFAESWVATVKRECLDHFVCFSLGHLDHIAQRYVAFYNEDRPHQGVGNRPLSTGPTLATGSAGPSAVRCRPYLGGLLKTYYRLAA